MILDFGRELSGGVRILTFSVKGNQRIRLRFGESVSEACSPLGKTRGFGKSTNDHSLRDFEVDLQNYSDMTFGQTGYFVSVGFLFFIRKYKIVLTAFLWVKETLFIMLSRNKNHKKVVFRK